MALPITCRAARCCRSFASASRANKSLDNELVRRLVQKIKATGPITVAEYMKEALTNPASGYYMHRDVFGKHGDFTTSPEISQMFGEMLGVWCVSEWLQSGQPSRVRLVEFGPGRGTLMDDLLRVFTKFDSFRSSLRVSLVEVSPTLSKLQAEKLCGRPHSSSSSGGGGSSGRSCVDDGAAAPGPAATDAIAGATAATDGGERSTCYRRCTSARGAVPVEWYADIDDVPGDSFGIYLAHEFFDALPIHKFQMTSRGWRELLVDKAKEDDPHHIRFVLADGPTAASKVFTTDAITGKQEIEVNPLAGVIVQKLAARIEAQGGSALIADYGHNGDKGDTFRAFKAHKLHDPLAEPGTADLTADVDFSFLRRCAGTKVNVCGPITQEVFLHNMGIGVRLKVLVESATASGKDEVRKSLISGYDMLTNPQKMGERFKFFTLIGKHRGQDLPAGFRALS